MRKFIRKLFIAILIIVVAIGAYGYKYYYDTVKKEPLSTKISEIKSGPDFLNSDKLPQEYLDAVVAVEDHRFYDHGALDFIGITRAIIINTKSGELQEGGSSITQQVAKNLYFLNENNNFNRKLGELYVSFDLQYNYTKQEILEIYVNSIYFGNGYYGIREACEGYLGKEPDEMTLSESTMMAGIPNAPSIYAPTVNKKLCKERQNKVISSMVQYGYITQEQADNIDQSFIDNIK